MKEFVEKLIGRMEEIPTKNKCSECPHKKKCDELEAIIKDEQTDLCGATIKALAIDIVNELAEEYNNGWIPCERELPKEDRKIYIVEKTNGSIDILGFAKDAYKLSKYDFAEYKGKKKPIFYDYDSEYGYIEWECVAWMPLPQRYKAGD